MVYGVADVRQHQETPGTLLFWSCRLPGVASHQRSHPSIPSLPISAPLAFHHVHCVGKSNVCTSGHNCTSGARLIFQRAPRDQRPDCPGSGPDSRNRERWGASTFLGLWSPDRAYAHHSTGAAPMRPIGGCGFPPEAQTRETLVGRARRKGCTPFGRKAFRPAEVKARN